ncbi:MAG TPA: hypothetical protein VNL15_08645 [Dehalococcoidia bacterium]|nr:hypothetical protein [Dehalococcoidia bacterium]
MRLTRAPGLSARIIWLCVALPLALVLTISCGGDSPKSEISASAVASVAQDEIVPIIVSSELVVGPNRFVVGLIRDNQEVLGAEATMRFFKIDGHQPIFKSESQARAVRVTKSYTEIHANGEVHTHEAGETGVYVANVNFETPGEWDLQINVKVGGQEFKPQRARFRVLQQGLSPAIGAPAPASKQTVLTDVGGDISKLDTSNPPRPEFHGLTIATALASNKPTIIAFASPSFCVTRICGPAKQVLDSLYPRYREQANFIHIEPYLLEQTRSGRGLAPVPVMAEWGLKTEPWIFLLDRQGKVAAKYEGMAALDEVEQALQQVLAAR